MYDKDILKVLNALGLEKKANEVMNTGVAGGGAELIPDQILMQEVFEAAPKHGTFLGALPGFHGSGLQKSQTVPIIGDVSEFTGNTEWTTGSPTPADPDGTYVNTGEVNLNQKPFIQQIAISRDLLNYSIADLESIVRKQLAAAAALTVESCILNGDPDASGNVNLDGGTPAATLYYRNIGVDGLRATAITATDTHNAGTLDFADFASIQSLIGDYAAMPSECMWLFNRNTHNKALTISEFATENTNGKSSTVYSGALGNILGSDYAIPRRMPLAASNGKISSTPGNNTLGQVVYFWKPAVQYGFGANLEIVPYKVPGKGVVLYATFDMAMAVVSEKAGITDPTVAMGINITV